jgi:hypothetical protein
VGGDSRCLLEKCIVEYISSRCAAPKQADHDDSPGDSKGAALCAMGNGKLSCEYSTIRVSGSCAE